MLAQRRYRHSEGCAHLLPFISHENGAEEAQGGEGLRMEVSSHAGFHDRALNVGLLHPRKRRLRPEPEPAPHANTRRKLKAGKKKCHPQMPSLASFKEKAFMCL